MSRRLRPVWIWRLGLLAFAVVYLLSGTLQLWLPPLLPFLAAAAVEAQFFFAGLRARPGRLHASGPGPQPRDLEELGWPDEDVDEDADESSSPPLPVRPVAARSRVGRRLLQALVVLALLAGVFLLDRRNEHWQHLSRTARAATVAMLDREAASIAGHPATVICDVSGRHVGYVQDADGLAEVGGRRAWLTPAICYQLYLVAHRHSSSRAAGHAIAVLAHESWHLHGVADESTVNCFAYQSGVRVGESLGLTLATARRLMHDQLKSNPTDFADSPAYIVGHECRAGGSLDLHLDGSSFP